MEQPFQNVDEKVQHDKNSDAFAAHFAQQIDQKPTLQQCRKIMKLEILSRVNHIGLMKTWNKSSFDLCMKDRIEKIVMHNIGTSN